MKGTWQTTDSGGSWKAALLVICALILLGSGGAVKLAHTAEEAAWAAIGVTALVIVGGAAFLVWYAIHSRDPSQEGFVRLPGVRMPQRYELPDPERAAIGQAVPRELHLHTHHHYHGAEAPREEILRRDQRPEQ
jgi:hypothetical protein